jgi:equilibrative nucleoside transporter 1/2/3
MSRRDDDDDDHDGSDGDGDETRALHVGQDSSIGGVTGGEETTSSNKPRRLTETSMLLTKDETNSSSSTHVVSLDATESANSAAGSTVALESDVSAIAPAAAADGADSSPPDKWNLVYIGFWLLGAAFLAPWNAVLSVTTYWDTAISPGAIFYFTICYMMSNLAGLGVVVTLGDRLSFSVRILPGLVLFAVVLIALLFVNDVYLANVCMGLLGIADSIVQGSVWALAGQYNIRMSGAVMAGNGLAGILITVIQLIIFLAIPAEFDGFERDAIMTKFFFAACVILIVVSAVFFQFVLLRSPVTAYYLARSRVPRADGNVEKMTVLQVMRAVAPQGVNAFLVFFVTLTLYPAIASLIQPQSYTFELIPFFVIIVSIFNVGDFIGRSLPRWERLIIVPRRWLTVPVLARVVFVPVFVLCVEPHLIASDVATYLIVIAFSLSNGYLGTLAMQFGPELVPPQGPRARRRSDGDNADNRLDIGRVDRRGNQCICSRISGDEMKLKTFFTNSFCFLSLKKRFLWKPWHWYSQQRLAKMTVHI